MPYYLSEPLPPPYPRRGRVPAGFDHQPNRNWIWLKEKALLWAQDPISDPRLVKIADDRLEALATAGRNALQSHIGRNIPAVGNFAEGVADILLTAAPGRWGALRPSMRRARYEIILGPEKLLWTAPHNPLRNTKTYQDLFTRANGDLNGDTSTDGLFTWTSTNWNVDTNRASSPTAGFNLATASADADTDDMYAQFTLITFSRVGDELFLSIGARMDATYTNGYEFGMFADSESTITVLNGNTDGELDSAASAIADGSVMRIEVDGSSIKGFDDGAEVVSATNSNEGTGAGNRRGAMVAFNGSGSSILIVDTFGYGDLTEVEVTPFPFDTGPIVLQRNPNMIPSS